MCCGSGLQVYRPEDASKNPVIGPPLGLIHRFVGRVFGHGHFQQVFPAVPYQLAYVKREAVKGALVDRPCRFAIDFHFRVGHRSFKYDVHRFTFPVGWHLKPVTVKSLLLAADFVLVVAIVVVAETMEFPARRHRNGCPGARLPTVGAHKFPVDGIVNAGARQVAYLCLLRTGNQPDQDGHKQQAGR